MKVLERISLGLGTYGQVPKVPRGRKLASEGMVSPMTSGGPLSEDDRAGISSAVLENVSRTREAFEEQGEHLPDSMEDKIAGIQERVDDSNFGNNGSYEKYGHKDPRR